MSNKALCTPLGRKNLSWILVMTPYQDISDEIRVFCQSVDEIELKWHRDLENREVVSIEFTDWKIQLDNKLPASLNSPVKINAGTWHRVIKGTGDLVVKIIKERGEK